MPTVHVVQDLHYLKIIHSLDAHIWIAVSQLLEENVSFLYENLYKFLMKGVILNVYFPYYFQGSGCYGI